MLITFEGIDGCGKTTQINLLKEALSNAGHDPLLTKQPGGTELGAKIRGLLLDRSNEAMCPQTELLLYMADRMQHLEDVIKPALAADRLVLCDRYHDATLAYQGGGRGLDLSWLKPLESQIIAPTKTFVFQISPEVSKQRVLARSQSGGEAICRLEAEEKAFFERTNQAYLALAQAEPSRFVVIDAELPIQEIHEMLRQEVLDLIAS